VTRHRQGQNHARLLLNLLLTSGRQYSRNPNSGRILKGHVSKGVLNIDLRRQPFETGKSLQYPPLPFGKALQIMPSISLKMKG
jgi:hypothetical protein